MPYSAQSKKRSSSSPLLPRAPHRPKERAQRRSNQNTPDRIETLYPYLLRLLLVPAITPADCRRCLAESLLATGSQDVALILRSPPTTGSRHLATKLRASVAAEIEFAQVAVKVLVIHVLIHTDQSALEIREESLNGIGVNVAAQDTSHAQSDR
jgi:hypothetical protein